MQLEFKGKVATAMHVTPKRKVDLKPGTVFEVDDETAKTLLQRPDIAIAGSKTEPKTEPPPAMDEDIQPKAAESAPALSTKSFGGKK